jgi:hypothetical protein
MGHVDVFSLLKGTYEEFYALRWRKNKAKQSQFIRSEFCELEVEKTKPIST